MPILWEIIILFLFNINTYFNYNIDIISFLSI